MDQTATATPPAVQWYNLGPSRSAKRSLFSFGRRRPDPIVYPETSPEQLADDPNWQRHDWGRSGSQFNRSMSMHVRSSRNGRKSCNSSSENSSQQTHTGVRLLVLWNIVVSKNWHKYVAKTVEVTSSSAKGAKSRHCRRGAVLEGLSQLRV